MLQTCERIFTLQMNTYLDEESSNEFWISHSLAIQFEFCLLIDTINILGENREIRKKINEKIRWPCPVTKKNSDTYIYIYIYISI